MLIARTCMVLQGAVSYGGTVSLSSKAFCNSSLVFRDHLVSGALSFQIGKRQVHPDFKTRGLNTRTRHVLRDTDSKRSCSTFGESGPPVRWGILSSGKIASDFAKAISMARGATATAVAARSLESAEKFAKDHEIESAYGSYDELLSDPTVDVVYIGSVAQTHFDLAKRSLLANKPTVVEKPLSLSLKDTATLVDLARERNVFFCENMWTRCFPTMKAIKEMIAPPKMEIGDVVMVQGDFGWSTANNGPSDRIWHPEAGGMILDVGMYLAQMGQVAYPGSKVSRIQSVGNFKNGVDNTVATSIMYDKQAPANANEQYSPQGFLQFYVTGEANTEERITIQGTKGKITINPPAHAPRSFALSVQQERGKTKTRKYEFEYPKEPMINGKSWNWHYPGSAGFVYVIDDVQNALKSGKKELPQYTLDESLEVAGILDEILVQIRETSPRSDKAT